MAIVSSSIGHAFVKWTFRLAIFSALLAIAPACMELSSRGFERHVLAWFIAGVFALLSTLLAVAQILNHLLHYRQPAMQQHVIRILWLVPVYSMNSWMALRFRHVAMYMDLGRELYEAFVIYSFVKYYT